MDALQQLRALQERLRQLPGVMPKLMKETFTELKPIVEDMVTAQLARGERGDGSKLPNYSPVSVAKFGKRPGPMTLYNIGNFYRGVSLEVHNDGIEVVGHDVKTGMLMVRYGEDIIDIQPGNLKEIETGYLQPYLEPKIEKFITHGGA